MKVTWTLPDGSTKTGLLVLCDLPHHRGLRMGRQNRRGGRF